MSAPTLIIAGLELPQESRLEYRQTFELIDAGGTSRRMANGALFTMRRWRKYRTTISGGGWIPAPLLALPLNAPFEVHAVGALALRLGESLPAGWREREDWPAIERTDRRGVVVRMVFPILTVKAPLGARYVVGGANPQWELVCEDA